MSNKLIKNSKESLYPNLSSLQGYEEMSVDIPDEQYEPAPMAANAQVFKKHNHPMEGDDECITTKPIYPIAINQKASKDFFSSQQYPNPVPPPIAESINTDANLPPSDFGRERLQVAKETRKDMETSHEQKTCHNVEASHSIQTDMNKVRYISSDEDEYGTNSHGKIDPEFKSCKKTSKHKKSYGNSNQRLGKQGTSYASIATGPKNYSEGQRHVDEIGSLSRLGKWKVLQKDQVNCQEIHKYVHNSYNVPETQLQVKIYSVHEIEKSSSSNWFSNGKSKNTEIVPKTLLWFKTTPESVRKLAEKNDTCIAFYDRVARAFSKNLKDIYRPFRQIILLCEVSLGKRHKSPVGFQYWSQKMFPPGYDSIKSEGIYVPKLKEADDGKSDVIPNTKTTEDSNSTKKSLLFNEYLVNEASRVNVRYAVDVEAAYPLFRQCAIKKRDGYLNKMKKI